MNRDKQMVADLIEIFDEEYYKRRLITPQNTAEKLTAKGYRKSTDLAREIFEEIDKILGMLMVDYVNFNRFSEADTIRYAITYLLNELKNKYTVVGNENEN